MSLTNQLLELSNELPAPFQTQKDGTLRMEYVVAERKWLLSKRKVTYRCRVRVDDAGQTLRMFEMLKESGFGFSSGPSDIGPGFGFKKEMFKASGIEREGTIDEQARFLGQKYKCEFDFSKVRNAVKKAAVDAGYAFSMCLTEGSV